ncbi:flagellar biosynthesis protein FlhB [Niallia circulans]|uniref:flagellar biosynthesis protein FlhB n=1 Tax=Shouchella clausii TaxID=79880 RepID=UPI000B96BAA6|nr:flagellar biosynthesis protein FlhB [Shouchella clausii]SPU22188.1 flagellar biosynthesis protein FlhB [Niallia circulans]AST97531.1 flagellar biosynthesis protein FlhB [Shouchella clausii]MCM3547009.1 flagellar biosynthesis protein FlhB [Shouchella clausii]MCR1286261.1 flagellar biosynthesis protein FlhB [Shouchella clausii]MEB5472555.1 flagellar biosynthesis protein FlhB [Shouchella clausii]
MTRLPMDLQWFAEEKTEKATPKKRQETRKKGQVPKSQDVNTAFMLFAAFLLLSLFAGPMLFAALKEMMADVFQRFLSLPLTAENSAALFNELTWEMGMAALPIMALTVLAGAFASFVQVGSLFTAEPMKLKLEKLDPIKGAKRIFSTRALVELGKSMLKIVFIGAAVAFVIYANIGDVLLLSQKSVEVGAASIGHLTVTMGLFAAVLLMVLAIPDYLYQRYDHEKQIRMSKKDIRDEHKTMEGDPKIRARRKQRQLEMSMNRIMQEVPKADVVITNPTHYAVALRYDQEQADAPIVVAKGVDYMAERIKTVAKSHDVPLVENVALARAMYASVELMHPIHEDMFQAVAEVLAYVYRLKKNKH